MYLKFKLIDSTQEDSLITINGTVRRIKNDPRRDSMVDLVEDLVGRILNPEETAWVVGFPGHGECENIFPPHVVADFGGGSCYCSLCGASESMSSPHDTQCPEENRQKLVSYAKKNFSTARIRFDKYAGQQYGQIEVMNRPPRWFRWDGELDSIVGNWTEGCPEWARNIF